MPEIRLKLEPDCFYHIYNRGINGCIVFKETTNYEHFLLLYDKYISPLADTYAWVLMGNHFHLLVRIKNADDWPNYPGFQNLDSLKIGKRITQQFSNLFNAYTKAYNKKYNRTGSLFEHTFRRKAIDSITYLRQAILYIHNNPVHHGFCEDPCEYPWSSYLTYISIKPTKLNRDTLIGWFDNEANFKMMHNQKLEPDKMDEWFGL